MVQDREPPRRDAVEMRTVNRILQRPYMTRNVEQSRAGGIGQGKCRGRTVDARPGHAREHPRHLLAAAAVEAGGDPRQWHMA
jgi:hypothetical protein